MELSREQSNYIKGLGILLIMIHNFVDNLQQIHCNEMIFSMENRDVFLSNVLSTSSLWYIFSYAGWIGLPLFLFLSGYGLTKKYNSQKKSFNTIAYIKSHVIKLLKLLLPVYLLYVVISYFCFHYMYGIRSILAHMTFTINLLHYGNNGYYLEPGVYWFFGAILQFYILFLFIRKLNWKWLCVIGIIFLAIHYFALYFTDKDTMVWIRQNFLGWGTSFVLGMIAAKTHTSIPEKMKLPIGIISFAVLCISLVTKPLAPFVEISTIVLVICLSNAIRVKWLYFLGVISASIFVLHPFFRMVFLNAFPDCNYPLLLTIIYIAIVIITSWLHHSVLNKSFRTKGINSK